MKSVGFTQFFTRADHQQVRKSDLPLEHLHKMGERAVRNMNPGAIHPNMPPWGSEKPILYILGEAPGAEEDRQGIPFVGASGRLLRQYIPASLMERTRINNCCRTRPPKNRQPSPLELECFRPSLEEDIVRSKPQVILAVGAVPMKWLLPNLDSIKVARGRRFPVKIRSHTCWCFPILHPAYILRVENQARVDDIPGSEWRKIFIRDLSRATTDIREPSYPKPVVEDSDEENLSKGLVLVSRTNDHGLKTICRFLELMDREEAVAIDLETTHLRPYSEGARILTVAVGTYDRVIAFPLDHPRTSWGGHHQALLDRFKQFLVSQSLKVIQKLSFELEWFAKYFGRKSVRASAWEDTMLQAYVLDERSGGHSLDFLSTLHFGLPLKSFSGVDRDHLEDEELESVLRYNAMDVKYTHKLFGVQRRMIQLLKLGPIYREQLRRIPTLVLAQAKGVLVDVDRVRRLQRRFAAKAERVLAKISRQKAVAVYRKRFGEFHPTSNQHLIRIFRDILHRPEGRRANNRYSTDKNVMAEINHPLARLIVALRTVNKIKSTYLDSLDPRSPKTLVYPDGRLHTEFKSTSTATGRLSSEGPNLQNQPKRKHAEIRAVIVAPAGQRILSVDYGQIEARVIGMASKDDYLCKALWESYDIHLEWAQKVAKAWPKVFRARGSDMTKFRSDIKNQLVFPAFYGSSYVSIAKALSMPDPIAHDLLDEFWDTFPGVKKWQQDLRSFYRQAGYVECLTGRRRHAPLSDNMVINSPIQGTASDIVVDAMNRLSEYALEGSQIGYLQPVLNIHDDLTFVVPYSLLDEALATITKMMLAVPFKWVNVPISIDVSIGRNWYQMEKIGTFSSNGKE